MKVIFEDDDIIVIKKPAGLATQSASISSKDCVSLLKVHLSSNAASNNKEPYIGIIHRLDQPVAGILVFAKNEKAAANLSKQVQCDIMCKNYHALVEGKCDKADNVEITNYIYKDSRENRAVIVEDIKKGNNKVKIQKAVLYYSTEEFYDKEYWEIDDESIIKSYTLLKIKLVTGRFHQIRAQLSNMGHPIAGDRKYGATSLCPASFADGQGSKKGAIALIADSLEFRHPGTNKLMHFEY